MSQGQQLHAFHILTELVHTIILWEKGSTKG